MNDDRRNGNTVLLTIIGVATLLVALVGATFAYFTATINNDNAQNVSVTTATPISLVYSGNILTLTNATPGMSTVDVRYTKTTDTSIDGSKTYYTRNTNTVATSGGVGEFTAVASPSADSLKDYYEATESTTHRFTVTNPTTGTGTHVRQTYDLTFVVDTNNFTTVWKEDTTVTNKTNQLVATINASTDNSAATFGTANTPVLLDTDGAGTTVSVSGTTATIDLTDGCTASWTGDTRNCTGTTNTAKPTTQYQLVQDQLINVGEVHTYEILVKFNETTVSQDENQGANFGAHIVVDDPKSVND